MKPCRYCGVLFTPSEGSNVSQRAKRLCRDCRYVLRRKDADEWAA